MTLTVPPAKRRIAVCADDFGLTAAATRSILELAAARAITATSCVVDGPAMLRNLAPLRALRPQLSVGLHLNLTENPEFGGNQSLPAWILTTFLRRREGLAGLQAELRRQLDRFEQLLDGAPDFVDGHEHVHQFPVTRELLLDELKSRYGARIVVRCTWPRHFRGSKAAVIAMLGARALRAAAQARGLRCNRDFAGVYDLRSHSGYAARMDEWLRNLDDGGLIMCHPESPALGGAPARAHEHQFFSSPEWPRILRSWNVALARLTAE
jgi:predicted glycoside hydrolase/deacetylase ChbG (UPF0249 family)